MAPSSKLTFAFFAWPRPLPLPLPALSPPTPFSRWSSRLASVGGPLLPRSLPSLGVSGARPLLESPVELPGLSHLRLVNGLTGAGGYGSRELLRCLGCIVTPSDPGPTDVLEDAVGNVISVVLLWRDCGDPGDTG